jgi:hypothetical protein
MKPVYSRGSFGRQLERVAFFVLQQKLKPGLLPGFWKSPKNKHMLYENDKTFSKKKI